MARRTDLKVQIDAESAKAEAAFERVSRSTQRMETQLRQADLAAASLDQQLNDEANKAAQQRAQDMEKLGRGLVAFGAATLAGLGLATKAAINWESAWAGVRKTVEGTPQELAALEGELRNLATTLPATHQEIAGVAEAAGQLGVATPDIAKFTEIMVHLGETTNLTAEEAATSIAQMMNVMQTAPEDVDNLASALVDLGNNGASTEAEIIQMAQRIAGAGAQIGLSESDVLAMANALASLGINAEAGGSAISKVMSDMGAAVVQGGDSLTQFADVAGMSSDQFATAFREDPAAAIATFVEGLGGIKAAGGDVFTTLDDMGLGSIRVRDALLRLAGGGDILRDSLELGATAWEDNTALIKEAEQRYDTAEAKIQVAKNTMVDLAIDVGGVLLPALSNLAENAASLIRWFGNLPGPVKTLITLFATFAGSAALVGGGFLLMAPRLRAAHDMFLRLARTSPVLAGGLSYLGQAAARLTVFGGIALGVYALLEATREAAPSVEDATQALLNFDDASKRIALDQLIRQMGEAQQVADRSLWDNVTSAVAGFGVANVQAGRDAKEFNETLDAFDSSIASMVQSGNLDVARESAKRLFSEMGAEGEFDDLVERLLPQYADALLESANNQQIAADGADENTAALQRQAEGLGMTVEELEAAEEAAQETRDAWAESIGSFVDLTGAYDEALANKEQRERESAEATAEATDDSSDSWEDYVGEVKLTVDDYLEQLERMVQNQQEWRENMVSLAGRVPDEMLAELAELGPKGAEEVALLSEMSDKELQRAAELWKQSTASGTAGIVNELEQAGPFLRQVAKTHGKDVADDIRAEIAAGKTTVGEAAAELGLTIEENIPGEIEVEVDLDASRFNNRVPHVKDGLYWLDTQEAVPLADLDIRDFRGQEGLVREAMIDLDRERPTPRAGLDTRPYFDGSMNTSRDIVKLDARRPTPRVGLDRSPFLEGASSTSRDIMALDSRRPTPRANLDTRPYFGASSGAVRDMQALDRRRPTPKLDLDDSQARDALRSFIAKAKEKITVTIGAIFGGVGGGGGGFGGSASGGWRTPMNRGSYRIGGGVGSYPGHTGQDLPAPTGTGVYAARAGRVSRAMTMRGSYGNHVYLDHAGGYQTRYAHLSRRNVSAGQVVPAGRRIGSVGSTGNSTGPHLHFEIRRGGAVLSPRSYIRFANGGPIEGPGGPRDDRIPILASNREFMMQAAAHDYYGTQFMHAINERLLPKIPHYASGGAVGSASSGGLHYGDTHVTVVAPMEQQVAVLERRLDYRDQARQMVEV